MTGGLRLSPEILLRSRKQVLYKQVNRWLREFDLPGDLASDQFTDTAFRLVLQGLPDSRPTNFADVGFGYSQVLPLLVQGLTAQKESLIIAEQPEIHLNPRLQSRLADFFGQVTKRDVSILVETHSEHLVLGLRRLVAQGTLQADDVAIYYGERTNGTSTARRVPIQENGHVESSDWPSGFFEDSLRESFELASAQVRRKRAR
jgi:predicted ATPase